MKKYKNIFLRFDEKLHLKKLLLKKNTISIHMFTLSKKVRYNIYISKKKWLSL